MFNKFLVLLFFLIPVFPIAAQSNYTMFFEPEFNLDYKITSKYAHSFGIENRNIIYDNSRYTYQVKHLEFAHTSEYKLNDTNTVALGLQYRFEDTFKSSEENEFRLLQAFEWETEKTQLSIEQKVRTEQRFYASTTKHRLRYELQLKFPLKLLRNNSDGTNLISTYISTETETLFEIAKTQKPEFEQRLSGVFGWQLSSKSALEVGLQYRLADYTQDLNHELFLVTGIEIQL